MEVPIIDLTSIISDLNSTDVDLNKLYKQDSWIRLGTEIRNAIHQVGCLYFINHGIPEDMTNRIFNNGKAFFDLPENNKMVYKKDSSNVMDITTYFGYNKEGTEKLHPTEADYETRQSFDCLEKYGRYPNDEVPGFQGSIQELFIHSRKLIKHILRLLAISLEFDDIDFFLHLSKHLDNPKDFIGLENVRLNYYPPVSKDAPARSVRAAPHSDYDIMTFLFQNEGGLMAHTVCGEWVNVTPIPGSIVVVTGLVLEYWTKGFFRAAPHKVLIPEDEVTASKSRQSLVYFHGVDEDAIICPIEINEKFKLTSPETDIGSQYSDEPKSAKLISLTPMLESYKGYT